MNNREKERSLLSTCMGLVVFGLLTTLLNCNYDGLKDSYKSALSTEKSAFFLAYLADKHFEHGEYGAFIQKFIWANYCLIADSSSCDSYYADFYAEHQSRLELSPDQAELIEQIYQVGNDEVTVVKTSNPVAWKEWGILEDGTLITITKLGSGRKTEVLTDEEVLERLQHGQRPSFIFRVEEDDSANSATIPVAKTAQYTGADFVKALQESGTAVVGVDSSGKLRLVRGGEATAAELSSGSKLYWPLNMDAATLEEANEYRSLFSYISMGNNVYCYKEPSYDCNWISSLARTTAGDVVEIRVPLSLLYDEDTWKLLLQYFHTKGITDWTCADPMFEESMLSAADTVVKRDVLDRPEYSNGRVVEHDTPEQDPRDVLLQNGIVDGLYLVVWQNEDQSQEAILLESVPSNFLKTADSAVLTP